MFHSSVSFQPLAIALNPRSARDYCNFCLNPLKSNPGILCHCRFVTWCSPDCARKAFEEDRHGLECDHLKDKFEEWTEVDVEKPGFSQYTLLLLRLILCDEGGVLDHIKDRVLGRSYKDLKAHRNRIRASDNLQKYFDSLLKFICATFLSGRSCNRERAFEIFCKIRINAMSIGTWRPLNDDDLHGTLGIAFHLDLSAFNHSCAPNADIFWDGRSARLVPLYPGVDPRDPTQTFISYVSLNTAKAARQRHLLTNYYFQCNCSRCTSTLDDVLTDFVCWKCGSSVLLDSTRMGDARYVQSLRCKICDAVQTEDWITTAWGAMHMLATFCGNGSPTCIKQLSVFDQQLSPGDLVSSCERLLKHCQGLLPPENLFYAFLLRQFATVQPEISRRAGLALQYHNAVVKCFPPGSCRSCLLDCLEVAEVAASSSVAEHRSKAAQISEELQRRMELFFTGAQNLPVQNQLHRIQVKLHECRQQDKQTAEQTDRRQQEMNVS